MNFQKIVVFIGACILFLSGCGEEGLRPIGQGVDMEALIAKRGGKILPDACSLVPISEIAEILGLTEDQIFVRNSTPRDKNPTHSSCFFKWNEPNHPNSGILIQALRNPDEVAYPDYISQWIESSKMLGEQGTEGGPVYFSDFTGFGDAGSYSYASGKYYWRLGEKLYFLVAFNATDTPELQFNRAQKLAYKITKYYIES